MCSSFGDSLYTNMNKVYYEVRRAAAEAREAHEAVLGLLESLLNEDDWILSYQMPRDLSWWTTVCEHSGDTFVS
ncbi:hypothetical protein Tco_0516412, partial [Tanacetum coccineum]